MTPLNTIIEILKEKNGNEEWKFSDPITVRFSDSDYDLLEIYGLCVSPKGELYVMADLWNSWYPVEEIESDQKLIQAIKERIDKIYKTKVA